jgi:hypothetical protein
MHNLTETTGKRLSGYAAAFVFIILLAGNAWAVYFIAINETPI